MNGLNRIYRLVWSVRSASWVAVSEIARSCSKRAGLGAALDAVMLLGASVGTIWTFPALAELPSGATVRAGAVSSTTSGTQLVVTQSTPKAIIDWTSFSIGRANLVLFIQPDANAIALNRVTGTGISAIEGGLWANGQVWLLNPNGMLIGAGGRINSAGFLGSTRAISDTDFSTSRYQFTGLAKPGGAIINLGAISVLSGGYVALAAEQVRNEGLIQADFGTVVLAGTKTFVMDVVGDKLLSFAVTGAVDNTPLDGKALVDNLGTLKADGGRVLISARSAAQLIDKVINTAGLVQANSASLANGGLVLGSVKVDGGENGRVSVDGRISVNAEAQGGKAGTLQVAGEAISLNAGARLEAKGPAGGGEILIGAAPGTQRVSVAAGATLDASATALSAAADSAAGGGKVWLLASDAIAMHGSIKANAAPDSRGSGGEVKLVAELANPKSSTVLSGAISAQAGNAGGNGGYVETSGSLIKIADQARVSTAARNGSMGSWLVDPTDLSIQTGDGAATTSTIGATTLSASLENSNVTLTTSANNTGTQTGIINVNAPITWSSAAKLTLVAHADININADISASAGSLALNYGQGAATGNKNSYSLYNGAQINLPAGLNFSTRAAEVVTNYRVLNSLGASGSATGSDLQGMRNLSGNFALGSNIDASASAGWNAGKGFEPITSFSGVFEGLGHRISKLTIYRPSENYVGLFSNLPGGSTIRNLGLDGGSVSGYWYAGALAGQNDGSISNSYSTARVSAGFRYAGGLVGNNYGSIDRSYATGSVTAGDLGAGGLLGRLLGGGSVSNSYATGSVSSSGDSAGGLVGSSQGGAKISNSFATGDVTGRSSVGGLVGDNLSTPILTDK